MTTFLHNEEPAIVAGIKTAAIGKKGSKPLSADLIRAITEDIRHQKIKDVQLGAFLGGLLMKGLTEEEKLLVSALPAGILSDPHQLCHFLAPQAPDAIKNICANLIQKKELDKNTAHQLGQFLFSDLPGDGLRGLAASILRVRYETADEYEGLLKAISETITPAFKNAPPAGKPIIQIAEPFDGVDQSNMIAPLLADYLQSLHFRVVNLVGRNSGPKCVNNLSDIAEALKVKLLTESRSLTDQTTDFGWYIHQKNISPAIDRWVDLRRQIIKRPFLATLERFVNPVQADIVIASAFHPPYGEKMINVCERAGFPAAIIVRNGMEGTIAFSLLRATKILCTVKQLNGAYLRHEFEFDAQESLQRPVVVEEKIEKPSLEENVRLIKEYKTEGKTHNVHFNLRIKATCAGITRALKWINSVKQ